MSRTAILMSFAVLAVASAAGAQEAVATAGPTGAPPTATAAATAAQVETFIHKAPPVNLDDGTPNGVTAEETPRKIHGEVGASVGSGGYRSGYVSAVMPVGKTGTVAIAVSETKFGRHGGGLGWDGGYAPYGDRQTLGLGLALGGDPARAPCRGMGFDPYSPTLPLEGERVRCRAPSGDR